MNLFVQFTPSVCLVSNLPERALYAYLTRSLTFLNGGLDSSAIRRVYLSAVNAEWGMWAWHSLGGGMPFVNALAARIPVLFFCVFTPAPSTGNGGSALSLGVTPSQTVPTHRRHPGCFCQCSLDPTSMASCHNELAYEFLGVIPIS